MALQHLRSNTANKRPTPAAMSDGQLAMNTNAASPGVFIKDSNGALVKVGPVHVGATAPNASPAVGGQTGNTTGEIWLDTASGGYILKVYDGTAWRTDAGQFVDSTGDTMTGSLTFAPGVGLIFEGATDDAFETTLTVEDPTADNTITFPNRTGTVITSADTGTVTSTMIADGTIVNGDINASAAIVDTKLATISTANKVSLAALDIDGATDIGAALADVDLFVVDDGGAGTNRKAAATRITDYAFGKISGDITATSAGVTSIKSSVALSGVPTAATAAVDTNTTQIATTAFVLAQAAGTAPVMNGTAAVGTSTRYARQDHVHPTDTSRAPLASPALTGTPTAPTAAVDTNTTQLATTAYVVGQGYLKSATASSTYAPLASPSLTGTPTAPTASAGTNTTQIATTAFVQTAVDAARQGLTVKQSCRIATTANITLSGLQTIDGVTLVANDRVLVKNQTAAAENGIYLAQSTAWTRSADFNASSDIAEGVFAFIEEGTTNGDSGWVMSTDGAISIGTTAISFVQFSGAGQITAGSGLTKTGNQLDVGTASSSRIVVNADNIDLATTGVTGGTYRSVTVDTYGRITAGTNPTTLAGYGITDAATSTHTHGNITNAGAIGSTANLPIITSTSGVLVAGSFGTAANTFCQGNDARLSDTRNTTNSLSFNNAGTGGASGSTFNGSAALSVSYHTIGALPSVISQQGGKTATVHDFNTYPNLYDAIFVNPTGSTNLPTGMTSVRSYRFVMGAGDTTARGFDLVGAAEGSGNLYIRERGLGTWSQILHSNNYDSYSPSLTGAGASGSWGISITGSSATCTGNAATATTLATARTINGVSFNGSANISVNTVNSLTFNNGGAGGTSGSAFNGGAALTVSYNTVGAPSTTGTNASGSWGISVTGSSASCTGNSATATTATNLAAGSIGTIPYQSAAGTTAMLAVGTAGQALVSNGAAAPVWTTLTLENLPDAAFKKSVVVATTADVGASTFSSGVLTGYEDVVSLNVTTTLSSTTATTTSTAGIKQGATISGNANIPAGTTVASITNSTTFVLSAAATAAGTAVATTFTQTISALAIDGVTLALNDRVLVKNQTATQQNGIYYLSTLGSTTVAWVLTRTNDANTASEIAGGIVNVDKGTTNGSKLFTATFKTTDTLNTTSMPWSEIIDTSSANSTAATIAMNGTQAAGTSNLYARADHVHPVDTSRAAVAQTMFIGTTSVAINRSSANLALTGISSIALPGATSGTITVTPTAVAGTTAITLPATTGTLITTGDTGTVTNTMLAGSIANAKLANSTISGIALGSNLNAVTFNNGGAGAASGATFNGGTAVTISYNSIGAAGTAANNTFTLAQRASIGTLTDGATITPDFATANNFTVTLAGNRTLANPTNQVAGQSGSIFIVQDATGSRTLAYGTNWEFSGGAAPTLSTTANAVDRLDYIVRANGNIHAILTKTYS